MKAVAAALSASAVMTFFVVMHADSPWFAPKPDDLFSVASVATTINSGQSVAIASVPTDRRLVVTDVVFFATNSTGSASQYGLTLNDRDPTGNEVVKTLGVGMSAGHSPGQGVVIRPGSDVVLKLDPSYSGSLTVEYFVAGYFTAK